MEAIEAAAIGQARGGDPEGFRVLVELHSRAVFRLAYRMTGNEQDAEDTVQETFLRAWRQIRRFDGRSKFGTWLHAITANCAVDLLRRRSRQQKAEEAVEPSQLASQAAASPSPEREVISRQAGRRVAAALSSLSPAERAAFLLRHFEGVSIEEISKLVGGNNGAVRHRVFRAVQKLRRALEPAMNVTP
jgi:RNA polymerase sigma-70 factor (ECF subfamily)